MQSKNVAKTAQGSRREEASLDSQYGEIGISAVAAALQYQSDTSKPAPCPVVREQKEWLADDAA